MKFVTFRKQGSGPRVGAIISDTVFDLTDAGFASMFEVIREGEAALKAASDAEKQGSGFPLAEVSLLAPVPRPPRIFGIGLNYASHAAESKMQTQAVPTVFMKLASSVTGPDTEVILPRNCTQPDFEAELAVVIGKPGYRIPAAQWKDHVFGYTILNDVSARDVQLATSQWTLGKSYPTFAPMGPAITTADEIADPHALSIRLTLNGEVMQNSNTRDLIFKIPQLIEYISAYVPLEAGDIISTGTPEGVGLGRSPQRWLQPDEEMIISIEQLGELRNRTRSEAAAGA